jgi:hypothetical protein
MKLPGKNRLYQKRRENISSVKGRSDLALRPPEHLEHLVGRIEKRKDTIHYPGQ